MVQEHHHHLGGLLAHLRGEVPAATLEAYQRAGGGAYDMLDQAEKRRQELLSKGTGPAAADAATRAFLLCAWNAFILQVLGDQFLQAEYQMNPATAGYVPPVTAEQVLSFYGQVEGWLSRARQAQVNPAYRLDVAVPAELPHWSEVDPCPRSHLEGMLAALRLLRPHAESGLQAFQAAPATAEQPGTLPRLQQIQADANTKADYAEQLWSRNVSQDLHERIESSAKAAIEAYYLLGQLLAMPELVGRVQPRSEPLPAADLSGGRLSLPGEPGFDPWCLTAPASRESWKHDRAAQKAIASLWQNDSNPRETLAIQDQINAAMARGDIDYATERSGGQVGWYFCCPWAAIYVARRPVTIGGRSLRPLQEFTYDVSAEGVLQGEPFRREILRGVFHRTNEVDYCDPTEQRDE